MLLTNLRVVAAYALMAYTANLLSSTMM